MPRLSATRRSATRLIAVLLAAVVLLPTSGAGADPIDASQADARAAAILEALRSDHSVRANRQLSPELRAELPPARLDAAWRKLVATLGPLRDFRSEGGAGAERAYLLEMGRGRARALFAFGAAGQVTGLWLAPSPAAATSEAGRALEVPVGEPPLLLGGTLVVPARPGRHPAALLLGPMGPLDRDGTAAGRRPVRDLAEALAAAGIASLRFDKRPVSWPEARDPRLTLERELVADAAWALAQLRARPEVDPARVFVVGLGVGGTVAPEVASRRGPVAAVAVLSAPPHPWPLALVEQARARQAAGAPVLAQLERDADRVLLGRLGPDELFAGYPASWWSDLAGRDPAAAALRLGRPLLVLRGQKDDLVTEDDLKRFQRALAPLASAAIEAIPDADGDLLGPGGRGLAPAAARRLAEFLLAAPPATEEPAGSAAYRDAAKAGRPPITTAPVY